MRLLLAGHTDVPIAKHAGEHLYERMLAQGIEIHEYQPQVLHAKLIVLDDVVYVGSCNLDKRSLMINYELLVRLDWPTLADEARERFTEALQHSLRIDADEWRAGTLLQRLRRRIAYWLLSRLDPVIANRKLKYLV